MKKILDYSGKSNSTARTFIEEICWWSRIFKNLFQMPFKKVFIVSVTREIILEHFNYWFHCKNIFDYLK